MRAGPGKADPCFALHKLGEVTRDHQRRETVATVAGGIVTAVGVRGARL
ncbi:MAG: hypothetical protein ACLU9S_19615 [Oscillospiraceae bacterium]